MPKLQYVGPDPVAVGVVPLPEGWPAADHEEPDAGVAAMKLTSGMYRPAEPSPPPSPRGRGGRPARNAEFVSEEELSDG